MYKEFIKHKICINRKLSKFLHVNDELLQIAPLLCEFKGQACVEKDSQLLKG